MAGLIARLRRLSLSLLPDSLFGRLAMLLVVVIASSHFLAVNLMVEFRPPPPHPPPLMAVASPMSPDAVVQARPPARPRLPPLSLGLLLDTLVRLSALFIAAWLGARWIAQPVRRLVDGAQALGRDIQRPPLPEQGTRECREATQVFNQMQAQIRGQMAQRDLFVAAVSHDLRTPLTRLALRAEAVPEGPLRDGLARDIREMEDMIRSTLDYLCGAADAEPAVVLDMVALLHSMAADAQEVGQDVQFEAPANLRSVPARLQPSSIRRCLTNLIDNAVRYGTSARIRLIVQATTLRVEVQDQGPGLAPDELTKVLSPFYRVDASRSRRHGGVGLGLAIADEIARRHRGELLLRNAPAGGLIATLSLPT